MHRLAQRAPGNKVVVAIANKLARIAWAVLSSGQDYHRFGEATVIDGNLKHRLACWG